MATIIILLTLTWAGLITLGALAHAAAGPRPSALGPRLISPIRG
jgi:hypothetical protein